MDESGILHYIQHRGLNIMHNPISLPNIDYKVGGLTKIEKHQRKTLKPTPTPIPLQSFRRTSLLRRRHRPLQMTKSRAKRDLRERRPKPRQSIGPFPPQIYWYCRMQLEPGGRKHPTMAQQKMHTPHQSMTRQKEQKKRARTPLLMRCLPRSQVIRKAQRT